MMRRMRWGKIKNSDVVLSYPLKLQINSDGTGTFWPDHSATPRKLYTPPTLVEMHDDGTVTEWKASLYDGPVGTRVELKAQEVVPLNSKKEWDIAIKLEAALDGAAVRGNSYVNAKKALKESA